MALPFVKNLTDADYISGSLILIDKPKGWTSFDVVNKVRGLIRHKYGIKKIKVGHSGTLDPMATGLLLICTGSWTKKLTELTGLDKKYSAAITLGIETDSYDAEGEVLETKEVPALQLEDIENVLQEFKGKFEQYPPVFSAIKKNGTPLYALARAGKEVKTEARNVEVLDILIRQYNSPLLELDVHCASGFYVRSLAHDIGVRIGCGGHLSGLVRTHIADYTLDDSFSMEEVIAALKTED